jgi:hypothetical protein
MRLQIELIDIFAGIVYNGLRGPPMIKPIPMQDQGHSSRNDMIPSAPSPQADRFSRVGKHLTKATFWMLVFSAILFALAAVLVRSVTAAPEPIIVFSIYYLLYHALHAMLLLLRLGKFVFVIRPKHEGVTIGGTFIALILTPISAGFAYLATIFLALSSCAG